MQKQLKKLYSSVIAVGLLTCVFFVFDAGVSASGWPAHLADEPYTTLSNVKVQPDGNIYACNGANNDYIARFFTPTGQSNDILKVDNRSAELCNSHQPPLNNMDSNGIVYGTRSSYYLDQIAAYDGDTLLWAEDIPQWCSGPVYSHAGPFVDADDNVYFLAGRGTCTRLLKIDQSQNLDVINIHDGGEIGEIAQYNDGFVMKRYSSNSIKYNVYSYDDLQNFEVYEEPRWTGEGDSGYWSLSPDGRIVSTTIVNSNSLCSDQSTLNRILTYNVVTEQSTTKNVEHECMRGHWRVQNSPTGDTILAGNENYPYRGKIAYLRTNGNLDIYTLPDPPNTHTLEGVSKVLVDEFGNAALAQYYTIRVDNINYRHVNFLLYNSEGRRLGIYSTESIERLKYFSLRDFTITKGNVYAIIDRGQYVGDMQIQLHQIPFVQLGNDFPRNILSDLDPTPNPTKRYVAMGDSFSSGEGVEPFIEATAAVGTNECHRSREAYSFILSDNPLVPWHLDQEDFVACSGATMENILDVGQWNEDPQIEKLDASVDAISLTIGGNDVHFGLFAEACVIDVVESCAEGSTVYNLVDNSIDTILAGPLGLRKTYSDILEAAPNATLYVMDYPQIATLDFGELLHCPMYFDFADSIAAHKIVNKLSDTIADAVMDIQQNDLENGNRIRFVSANTSNSPFNGHNICSEDRYFHGVDIFNKVYSFHPNAKGQRAYYEVLRDYIQ